MRTLHFECSLKPEHSVLSASQCSKISVHSVLSALRFLCFAVHWRVHTALCVVWVPFDPISNDYVPVGSGGLSENGGHNYIFI